VDETKAQEPDHHPHRGREALRLEDE
jgi:hypothetical protein